MMRNPSLLTYHSSTLRGALACLATLVKLPQERVVKLVLKQPALLMLSPDRLRRRMQELMELFAGAQASSRE